MKNRNVEIVTDKNGKKLVKINDIRFKGKRSVDWNDEKHILWNMLENFIRLLRQGM